MATVQPDSVLVKKSFLRDVADRLEDMDERIAIMAENEAAEQDFGFDFPED